MASSSPPLPSFPNLLQPLILIVLLLLVFLVQHPAAILMSERIPMEYGDSTSSAYGNSPSWLTYGEREREEITPGGWKDIKDVVFNEQVQALGQFAVDEANKKAKNGKSKITFMHVLKAEQMVVSGTNYYKLWIQGKVDRVAQVFQITVFAGITR